MRAAVSTGNLILPRHAPSVPPGRCHSGQHTLGAVGQNAAAALFSSEDGAHVAYVGRGGEKVFVGRDNREEPPFDAFSGSVPPTFGGGGRHLAYAAQVPGGDFRLIVDGEPMGTSSVAPIAPVVSPDGGRLAYVEMR